MTVTYTAQVASSKRFGCFWKLLFRWKGSIYKLLWPNLTVYIMLYAILSVTYRFLLNEKQRYYFEKVSLHCQTYGDLIPVSFVLGFFVSIVIKRWWDQFLSIPWPDPLAVFVSAFVTGQDDRARLMRRTIMRYANLSYLLTLRMVCPAVKKRFPTYDHMVEAGFMLPNERKIFEMLAEKTSHPMYWMPLVWATSVISRARREGRIKDDFALKTLIDEVNKFRGGCGGLLNYDWISVPLVYTQVVTLAVYTYFLSTLMGNQYLDPSKGYSQHPVDLMLPIFQLLQFFFYMGWLLVAETLVNPFGDDDDDFEVNWLIDRNLQISYLIVDEMHEEHPELVKDQYWDEVIPSELPYTAASKHYYTEPFLGSTWQVEVPRDKTEFVPLSVKNVEFSEKKSTTPMLIRSYFVKNECSSMQSVAGSTQEGSNSVLNILRKKLGRDDSRKSVVSCTSSFGRKGHKSSRLSSSQLYSYTSSCKLSDDFQDDIFKMSDFSVVNITSEKMDNLLVTNAEGEKIQPEIISQKNDLKVQNPSFMDKRVDVQPESHYPKLSDFAKGSIKASNNYRASEVTHMINDYTIVTETEMVSETPEKTNRLKIYDGQIVNKSSFIEASVSAKITKIDRVSPNLSELLIDNDNSPLLQKTYPDGTECAVNQDSNENGAHITNVVTLSNENKSIEPSRAIDIPIPTKHDHIGNLSPSGSCLIRNGSPLFEYNLSKNLAEINNPDNDIGKSEVNELIVPNYSKIRLDKSHGPMTINDEERGVASNIDPLYNSNAIADIYAKDIYQEKQVHFGNDTLIPSYSGNTDCTTSDELSTNTPNLVLSPLSINDNEKSTKVLADLNEEHVTVFGIRSDLMASELNTEEGEKGVPILQKYKPSPAIDIPVPNLIHIEENNLNEQNNSVVYQYHKLEPIKEESEVDIEDDVSTDLMSGFSPTDLTVTHNLESQGKQKVGNQISYTNQDDHS